MSTKFPEMPTIDDHLYFHEVYARDIDEWFRECMADFPERSQTGPWEVYDIWEIEPWFDKWFGQFKEPKE